MSSRLVIPSWHAEATSKGKGGDHGRKFYRRIQS